jgi:hypothetical protein
MKTIVLIMLAACGSPSASALTSGTAFTGPIEQRVCIKARICEVAEFNDKVCQKCVSDAIARNPKMPVESLLESATCEGMSYAAEATEMIDCVRPDYIVDFTK